VDTLVADPGKTINEGAVLPWNAGSRRLFAYAAGELGVRLDVPYRDLTRRERQIVMHGEPAQRRVTFQTSSGRTVSLNVNYENAVAAAERAARGDNERSRRQAERYVVTRTCSVCHGTRLSPKALSSRLDGRTIAEIAALDLDAISPFAAELPASIQPTLQLLDPLALAPHRLSELGDLAIHPQQDLDHDLPTLVIDRLRLQALHTTRFDAPKLCPPTN
jgi:excinuclease ABC subunit A